MTRWSPAVAHALVALLLLLLFEHALGALPGLDRASVFGAGAVLFALALPALVSLLRLRQAHYERLGIRRFTAARFAADVATVFGAGLTPRGSGTVGAVAALPAGLLIARLEAPIRAAVLASLLAASIAATHVYLQHERENLDPKEVVVDEWIGVLLALAFVPWCPLPAALAFGLFRLFDITKPGPIAWVEHRLPGASGVVFDDVLAGLLAGAILALARHFTAGLFSC